MSGRLTMKQARLNCPVRYMPKYWWLLTNLGAAISVHRTYAEAIRSCMTDTNQTWGEVLQNHEVRKVVLKVLP